MENSTTAPQIRLICGLLWGIVALRIFCIEVSSLSKAMILRLHHFQIISLPNDGLASAQTDFVPSWLIFFLTEMTMFLLLPKCEAVRARFNSGNADDIIYFLVWLREKLWVRVTNTWFDFRSKSQLKVTESFPFSGWFPRQAHFVILTR